MVEEGQGGQSPLGNAIFPVAFCQNISKDLHMLIYRVCILAEGSQFSRAIDARLLPRKESQSVAESLPPREFVMAPAFDANDSELVVVPPALFTEQAAELPVVGFVICVPRLCAVVEIHSNSGGQCGSRGKGLESVCVLRAALRDISECGGEAGKVSKDARMMDGNVEADQGAERGSAKDPRGRLREGAVAGVHVREKFCGQELRVGRAAQLWGQIVVAQRRVFFRKALRVAHGRHDGLGHHAMPRKKVHPFIRSPIHAGNRTRQRIEHVRSIVQHDYRKAPLRLRAVALRQPHQQFAVSREHAGVNLFLCEASAIAVFPISHRVVLGGIQPRFARKVRGHVAVGIHAFSLPGVSENLVFERRACFDLSKMIGRLPVQPQAFLRLPVTQRRNASRNENRLVRTVNWRENLKADLAHGE